MYQILNFIIFFCIKFQVFINVWRVRIINIQCAKNIKFIIFKYIYFILNFSPLLLNKKNIMESMNKYIVVYQNFFIDYYIKYDKVEKYICLVFNFSFRITQQTFYETCKYVQYNYFLIKNYGKIRWDFQVRKNRCIQDEVDNMLKKILRQFKQFLYTNKKKINNNTWERYYHIQIRSGCEIPYLRKITPHLKYLHGSP
eukprot:TRINITY_DN35924_c0_g3_i1.p2 TRINITY_DN35924_c0_g3~~TRINITY_DN35924_c0_g3_i1.p2  ORF type:complete len:198 (+),score=-7.26 TRINITY_DN35924_c0_g3_i1:254-847(+)